MLRWILLISILLLADLTFAQKSFERNYGDLSCYDEGYGAIALGDGYLLSTSQGCSGGPANNIHVTIRLNDNGDTIYTRSGNPFNGFVKRVASNTILYLGREQANLLGDTSFVFLTDTAGGLLWSTPLFYGCFTSVYNGITSNDGGYYITGFSSSVACTAPVYDGFLTKLDSLGQEVWSRQYDLGGDDQLYDLHQLDNGNIALAGWTNGVGQGQGDAWLLITDELGNTVWEETYGTANNERCYGLAVSEEGYLLQLATDSSSTISTDTNGVVLWQVNSGPACGGAYHKVLFSMDFRPIALSYENVEGNCQSVLTKRDSLGNLIWRKVWPALFRDVKEIAAGSFLMTGYNGFPPQVYVVKFDTTFGDTTRPVISSIRNVASAKRSFNIYPNPTASVFSIDLTGLAQEDISISIYNAAGKIVYTKLEKGSIAIDVSSWNKGVYWVEVSQNNGSSRVQKVIVLR